MSLNRRRPHVFVLPEDDANRNLANGFVLDVTNARQIRILPGVGGWRHVAEIFNSDHVHEMRKYPDRFMVLFGRLR
jgi:hypothetical protein